MAFKALLFLCFVIGAFGAAWNTRNDPSSFGSNYNYIMSQLPKSVSTATTPWSDTYWPSFQGGIANRWQDSANGYPGFNYHLNTKAELQSGSVNINVLSPAEKYDIFLGRYDYPLVNSEWNRVSPNDANWEGLCHGWAPAAIDYKQPNATAVVNPDGIQIQFGSSDVKALLTYFLAQYAQGDTRFVADRCNTDIKADPSKANLAECWDINPGTFHVIMANEIGLKNIAFVADVDRSIEVWNQPVFGYQFSYGSTRSPSNGSAPGTNTEQLVQFTMSWTKETAPSVSAHQARVYTSSYAYWLELDSTGRILGGSYDNSDWDRCDFLWGEKAPSFSGYFNSLGEIYKRSIQPSIDERVRSDLSLLSRHSETHTERTGRIHLTHYDDKTHKSWLISPQGSSSSITVQLDSMATRRQADSLRVYEVSATGDLGALVTVWHGSHDAQRVRSVTVRSPQVLVTFDVNVNAVRKSIGAPGSGFVLRFSAQ